MSITLANPVAALSEKIAQPLDDADLAMRNVASLYRTANGQLQTRQQTLIQTFEGLGADAFTDMIAKQVNWVDNITNNLDSLAGFYKDCANTVRTAAQYIEGAIQPFLDLVQWVLDRLTPDIVVKEGESAVHAVFNDMRAQVHREIHDAGSFFGNIAHLRFGDALDDAVDGVKGLAHLTGDVIALVAAVEPILCQWATDVYEGVNWLTNKIDGWLIDAVNWLLGLDSIADDTAVFTDPNSTTEEKWLAGVDMGVNIAMDIALVIPGADIFALLGKGGMKLLEKFGLKVLIDEAAKRIVAKITETVVAQIVKDIVRRFTQKIAQKFSDAIVKRMLQKELTKTVFNNLEKQVRDRIFPRVQAIIDDYLAGRITKEEAQRRLDQLLKDGVPGGGRRGIWEPGWSDRFPGLSPQQLAERVEKLRQNLLSTNDLNKIKQSMQRAGINLSNDEIRAIKNYDFDSAGISFTRENYDAWRRLATGKGTIDDVRYLVHELAEVNALKRTGFDFMGRGWETMTSKQRRQWVADFDRHYAETHSQALLEESRFLSQSLSDITNGNVHLSPVIIAAIGSEEARRNMLVNGLPLIENRNFAAWESEGNRIVTLPNAIKDRLGLGSNKISIKDLIEKLKKMQVK
jgi:hypothetical protein